LLVGVLIRCYGWIILLANNGLINNAVKKLGLATHGLPLMYNSFGVGVGLVHVFLPFMILPVLSAIQSIDRRWRMRRARSAPRAPRPCSAS
jgi:putative spermidine/putrescine transport system permease protein